jgi:hypothetical protein
MGSRTWSTEVSSYTAYYGTELELMVPTKEARALSITVLFGFV